MRMLLAIFCAGLPACLAAQTVYRCDGAGAVPVFQQQPCAGAGRVVDARPVNAPLAVDPDAARILGRRPGPGLAEADALLRYGAPTLTVTDSGPRGSIAREHVWRHADGSTRTVKTRDGIVTAIRERPSPRRRGSALSCPSAQQIRNARVSASSLTLTKAERAARAKAIERMESCGRGGGARTPRAG